MNRRDLLKTAGAAALGAGIASQASAHPTGVNMLNAVWVHGTSFEAEDLNALNGTIRQGWGATFRGKSNVFTWFHVSIPTPVIIDDVRPRLEKVFVFYKTTNATLMSVHFYDGPRIVRRVDNQFFTGDHSTSIVSRNTFTIPAREIVFGLGLSIGVRFGASPAEILFTTAGADFRLRR